jgi:hypothetical protein
VNDQSATTPTASREALSHGNKLEKPAFAFSHDMLAHVDEHRHLFRTMAGKRSGATVQSVLRKLVIDLVRDDLKMMVELAGRHSVVTDAVVEFIADGLFGMLMWWLGGKARLSVEELDTLFRRFAIPAAETAPRA